jgi:hypothetical protein
MALASSTPECYKRRLSFIARKPVVRHEHRRYLEDPEIINPISVYRIMINDAS